VAVSLVALRRAAEIGHPCILYRGGARGVIAIDLACSNW
jgi:hypothetical protein